MNLSILNLWRDGGIEYISNEIIELKIKNKFFHTCKQVSYFYFVMKAKFYDPSCPNCFVHSTCLLISSFPTDDLADFSILQKWDNFNFEQRTLFSSSFDTSNNLISIAFGSFGEHAINV